MSGPPPARRACPWGTRPSRRSSGTRPPPAGDRRPGRRRAAQAASRGSPPRAVQQQELPFGTADRPGYHRALATQEEEGVPDPSDQGFEVPLPLGKDEVRTVEATAEILRAEREVGAHPPVPVRNQLPVGRKA